MLPLYQLMQERIDRINMVLREQITGIRVVRAFGRETHESGRFETVNRDLTETSLRAGRLMAVMFPLVVLVLNASSVAAIWLGGDRIASCPRSARCRRTARPGSARPPCAGR